MKNIKLFLMVISFTLMVSGSDLLLVVGHHDVPYNWVKTEFHIYKKAHLDSNVSIYNLAGTKIANVTDKYIDANTSLQVNLNNLFNLSTGSYMAVVSVGNEVVMRKFIKQ